MSNYTPTTDEVRDAYGYWSDSGPHAPPDEFNRWLAAHDAEVRAQALNEAADKIYVSLRQAHKRAGRTLDPLFSQHDQGLCGGYKNAERWLRARAEQTKEDS